MQDAKIPMPIAQASIIHEPDSHVIVQRFIALLIDSVILAFIIAWSTRALGVAQTGTDTSVPGIIFSVGGAFYNIANGSGSTSWVIKLSLTVNYPIKFVADSYQPNSKTQVCIGVVTLSWQWTMLSWQQDASSWDVTCHNQ